MAILAEYGTQWDAMQTEQDAWGARCHRCEVRPSLNPNGVAHGRRKSTA